MSDDSLLKYLQLDFGDQGPVMYLYLLAHLVVFLKEGLGSPSLGVLGRFQVYFEKIRVLKAGFNA